MDQIVGQALATFRRIDQRRSGVSEPEDTAVAAA
jgi:hypothetical protein